MGASTRAPRASASRELRTSSPTALAQPATTFAANARPSSLEIAVEEAEETMVEANITGWRRMALALGGYFSRESRSVRGAERLYEEVSRATSESALYDAHGVERTFASEHAMRCLHVWLCLGRLRKEREDAKVSLQIVPPRKLEEGEGESTFLPMVRKILEGEFYSSKVNTSFRKDAGLEVWFKSDDYQWECWAKLEADAGGRYLVLGNKGENRATLERACVAVPCEVCLAIVLIGAHPLGGWRRRQRHLEFREVWFL